jgi:hypothetical protein
MTLRAMLALGVLPVAMIGCNKPTQEANLLDYPEMVLSTEQLDFGTVEHGSVQTRTFTIQNTGDLPMGVSEISEALGKDENFGVAYSAADITCPEAEGAGDTGSAGDEAEAKDASPPPLLVVSTSELDFGSVAVGDSSVLPLTITNAGDEALTITTATVSPSGEGFSLLGSIAGAVLEASESKEIYINYEPASTSGNEAQLIVVSNSENGAGGVDTVALMGNMSGTGETGDTGPDTGPEDSVPVEDPDSDVLFVLDPGCKIPVQATFEPVDVGVVWGSIKVTTKSHSPEEDGGEPEYYADLDREYDYILMSGEAEKGIGRAIVKPRTVDFGHVWTGLDEVRYIEVSNAGDGDLNLLQPSLDETCDEDFTVTWSYAPEAGDTKALAGGAKTLLELTYTPSDVTAAYCTVYINSDDADNEPPTVTIRSPEPGYRHVTTAPLELEINVFDSNQPATSLSCRVKSAVQLSATVARCEPEDDSGHVVVEVPMDYLDPGTDTFLVEVIDGSATASYASIPVLLNSAGSDDDDDGDGYGEYDTGITFDCDDGNINTYPKAAEVADGADNDCDGDIDEGTAGADDDGDSFTENDGDCDDSDASTYPGAPEAADRQDNNCDGVVDENTTLYDDDGDGYAEVNIDCDDANPDVNPGAHEICDNIDNDCNGLVDDACLELTSEPYIVGGIDMSQTAVEVGETITMSVFVYDADGQDISYFWEMDGGSAPSVEASNLQWQAPAELPEQYEDGNIYEIYVVAQDEDGHKEWDFARPAVYPQGVLHVQYVEIVTVEPEGGCSALGGSAAGLLASMLAGLVLVRRRED